MSKSVTLVESISKAYQIGLQEEIPDTLVAAATSWMRAPLRNLSRLRRLNTFDTNNSSKDVIWALKDVSFNVREGEVLGIIGHNGAGKSTLLKILSRITDPTYGRAVIRGRVSSLLEVGTGFHPELTGRENIYLNGTILGMTKREIDRKFDEIVDFSGVERFLDTPVKRYSSGMTVRLAFAVAAHLDPEILIIDEVLAVGDAAFQSKCMGRMQRVAGQGRTVLFVSHNMTAVRSLCSRTILLQAGSVVAEGSPNEVITSYLSHTTRRDGLQTLQSRVDREGSGDLRFESVSVTNHEGGPVHMGDEMRILMTFSTKSEIRDCNFGFHIKDSYGQVIYRVITRDICGILPPVNGQGRAYCRISCVYLLPGVYHILIYASINLSNAYLDLLSNAMEFEVHPSDVYGTGRLPNQGVAYLPCHWTIE